VLQSPDDPARFILYEAYTDPAGAVAHKETQHYLSWRETVADWMAEPRQGISWRGLFPA
jgi:autoinducer 2-degrading protein